jgi:hypothetical protein
MNLYHSSAYTETFITGIFLTNDYEIIIYNIYYSAD